MSWGNLLDERQFIQMRQKKLHFYPPTTIELPGKLFRSAGEFDEAAIPKLPTGSVRTPR